MTSCLNCEVKLTAQCGDGDDLPITHFLVNLPGCVKRVAIFEALGAVFSICPTRSVNVNNDLVMCVQCGSIVEVIYRSYLQLKSLSKATAEICMLLHQARSWHRSRTEAEDVADNATTIEFSQSSGFEVDSRSETDQTQFHDNQKPFGMLDPSAEHEKREIRVVPKKRKINTPLSPSRNDEPNRSSVDKPSRRKTLVSINRLSEPEDLRDATEDDDDNLELETDEWKPNVRRSRRISAARLKLRKQRVESKQRRKKLTVKYAGKRTNATTSSHGSMRNQIQKRKRGRPPNTNLNPVTVKAVKMHRKTIEPKDRQLTPDPLMGDEHEFEAAKPVQMKKYKRRSKAEDRKKPVLICTDCPAKFYAQWMLEHHKNYEHLQITPKECLECGLKCFKDEILQKHFCVPFVAQEEDRAQRPFVCQLCGRSMANRGNFTHHNMAHDHSEESRHKCGECKLTFKIKENLVKHEKIHAMPRNSWQCDICGKVFYVKRRLKEHKEIHLEPKRYMCSICGMRFAQQKAMIRHGTIHANLNRHQCPLCGKGFKRKDHLLQHYRSKVHPRALIESLREQNSVQLPMDLFKSQPDPAVFEASDENIHTETQDSQHDLKSNFLSPGLSNEQGSEVMADQQTQILSQSQHDQMIVQPIQSISHPHHPHQPDFGFSDSDLLSL